MKKLLLLNVLCFCSFFGQAQNISVTDEQNISSCNGSAFLDPYSINTGYIYAWWQCSSIDSTLQTNLGSNINSINNLCPGLYALEYHDSLFMVSNFDTLVYHFTVNAATICSNFSVSATGVNESSSGACDGSATAAVSGANGTVTYSWSNSVTTPSVNGLCAGNYTVTATDTASCSDSFTVSIIPDSTCSNFFVSATGANETSIGACDGSATATVSGANGTVTYSWSNSANTPSINGLCAGNYTVTATDTAACSDSYTVNIGSNTICSNFSVSAAGVNESSSGACDGSANASVSGANGSVTFSWSNSATTPSINGLCAGNYTVTATDTASCSDSFTVSIIPDSTCSNFFVSATGANETSIGACDGSATATVSGANGTVTYSWSNSANTPSINGLCAGNYTVTATDTAACSDSYTVNIGSNTICSNFSVSATGVNESSSGACDGSATASVSGANGSVTFSWSNSVTTPYVNGLCAGNYTVTATDTASCSDSFTISIASDTSINQSLLAYSLTSQESINGACDGSVQIVVYGGVAPYTYSHSSGSASQYDSLLCSGIYNVLITDSQNDSLYLTYIISSPLTTYNTYNYIDSTIVDTIICEPIENCIVDYSSIDTAFISNILIYGTDSIMITWTISSSAGLIDIDQFYNQPNTNGVYTFVLDIFCYQRAPGDNVFTFIDQYYFNTSSLGYDIPIMHYHPEILAYPNPLSKNLTIEMKGNKAKKYVLLDINGRQILTGEIRHSKEMLDFDHVTPGTYILQIDTYKPIKVIKL